MAKRWETQNKRRPGAYINFVSKPPLEINPADGLAVIFLEGQWGAENKFVEVDDKSDYLALFGKEVEDLLPLREAFKGSRKVLVYTPTRTGATIASNTTSGLNVTAKYSGSLGNEITVVVNQQTDDLVTVTTAFNNQTVDIQTDLSDVPADNDFVTFSGALPDEDATIKLTNGADGTTSNDAYAEFLNGLDQQTFSHIALNTTDTTIKELALDKVIELRSLGKPVFLVTNNFAVDHEAVTSLVNGVELATGETLTAGQATYWLASASASAGVNSLTYAIYPNAIDTTRYTEQEVIVRLNQGHTLFIYKNNAVIVEQDQNTLTTFTKEKNQDFSKNKILRTMATIERQVTYLFETRYIGKVSNNVDGRENFKSAVITQVLDPLVELQAVEYEAETIEVLQGETKESVVVNLPLVINDAMEKLYMTVTVG